MVAQAKGGHLKTHFVVPDTQCKPGTPMDHLSWIGAYAVEREPDVIVHLGDHWDMPSLSSYDKGRKAMEGRRYSDDILVGNAGFALINDPIQAARKANRKWRPSLNLLRGNHEERILRAVESDAQLEGALGHEHLKSPGWNVHGFLDPVFIDGVMYSHYFYNPMTGRPYGGANVETRIKTIGRSFTMGHQQGLKFGIVPALGGDHYGLIAGSAYLHDEQYLGPQGNLAWRGIVVCHQTVDGTYDPMFVSLDFLARRYEGLSVGAFLRKKYPTMDGTLWRAP